MTMIRCSNDLHYYDSAQYDSCPYCNSTSAYDVPSYIVKGQNYRIPGKMNAKAKLRIGNIFDISSDLIILPCNTYGNVTDFVAKSLKEFGIAYPPPNMSLGYVYIKPFTGIGSAAKYIGFAVSVDRHVSNPEAINYIGQQIGQFTTQEPSIRIISAPLLGVGAGGLTSEVAATQLKEGFLTRAHSESILVLSVLQQDVFERIFSSFSQEVSEAIKGESNKDTAKTIILFLGANPSGSRLKLDDEVRKIQTNLKLAKDRDSLELKHEWAVTTDTLMQAMLDESPNIVHFSGHGEQEGIILQDEIGNPKLISTEALENLFGLFKDTVKCVVLNSCYSESQVKAIKKHIPYVIGMKAGIPDEAAISFATGFYKGIGAGKNIPFAFNLGVAAIKLAGVSGDDVPVLY